MSDSFEVLQAVDSLGEEICRLQTENARLRVEVIEAKQALAKAQADLAVAESRHSATTDILVRKCSALRTIAYEAARAVGWKVVEDDE